MKTAFNLLAWLIAVAAVYAVATHSYGPDAEKHAARAAQPFEGHDDQVTGPTVDQAVRAIRGPNGEFQDPSEAIE